MFNVKRAFFSYILEEGVNLMGKNVVIVVKTFYLFEA